ncbi:MAG: hypothetical protein ACYSWZ_05580 [Planctomycetota bacterium]|jgi:hypothetical protein
MKPEIQIKVGRWTAILLLVGALGNMLIVLFTFRHDPIVLHGLIWPIFFSNGLAVLFFVCIVFTISRRLLKTNLLLLVVYILLIVRTFFTWEYVDVLDYFHPFFELFFIFCLSQGVIGMRREKLIRTTEVETGATN